MATKTKNWSTGTGSATIEYGGQGDGQITITSDPNNLYESRSMQITVRTTDGSNVERTITINQAAKAKTDISTAVVTASNQTYSGSAKTPTPTVTLNGIVIPSSGYDVSYSNNTNAGTATITITGKGEYEGTATGTFTIAKASRSLSFNGNYMVLNTSSTGTKTATPSAGSGDGAITYSIANTTYATINSSSGEVTSKNSDGSVTVTATIAEGTNYLSATTTYTLYVFATTHNYSYNGSYRSVTLPPGTYQFQCWGAQGGSNGTNSTYGITAQAGGKGGYSVGQLTVSQATAIRVYVGGQGSSSSGGYNGGGSTTGTSQYTSGNLFGYSKMGGGGGATDIRLNDGSLYSRMIVAGGGAGGAMDYKKVTTSTERETNLTIFTHNNLTWTTTGWGVNAEYATGFIDVRGYVGKEVKIKWSHRILLIADLPSDGSDPSYISSMWSADDTRVTIPSNCKYVCLSTWNKYKNSETGYVKGIDVDTSISENRDYSTSVGAGGGTSGIATSGGGSTYAGTQSSAGENGSFGQGASQSTSNRCFVPGAGGGGWYGGGSSAGSYVEITFVKCSGGGSGFVNTAASAGNRPSGYTGLQLDSGTTYAGNTSFPATSGSTETGHSGNGYAKITRLS